MNKSPIYDPVKRRCVVYNVLKDFLPTEYYMKALWILEEDYAKQHSLPILEFIDHIEQLTPLGNKKKPLRERLTKELYFSDEIGEDPWEDMMRFKRVLQINQGARQTAQPATPPGPSPAAAPFPGQSHTPAAPPVAPPPPQEPDTAGSEAAAPVPQPLSPALVVFDHMIGELNRQYTHLSKGHIQKFYSFLINQLPELEIRPEAEAAIIAWCHHDGDCELSDVFSPDEMSQLIHVFYLWGCEALGPEQTDRIFSRAIHQAESLPEADEFPPTELM